MNEKPRVLVPLGTGFEELEAVAAIDLLRRAGCQVVTCSVGSSNPIIGRNRMRVMADLDLSEALAEWGDAWDLVLLPGGLSGVEAMEADQRLMALVADRLVNQQFTAAICAAPRVLARAGLDTQTPITGHPACRDDLAAFSEYREDAVVEADAVITSRGPGTAVAFALACNARLCGPEKAREIQQQIVG